MRVWVLERLVRAADEAVLANMELDSPAWETYFGVHTDRSL
jgi:hypothetical protein